MAMISRAAARLGAHQIGGALAGARVQPAKHGGVAGEFCGAPGGGEEDLLGHVLGEVRVATGATQRGGIHKVHAMAHESGEGVLGGFAGVAGQ
jgi:hypothetical protein